MNKPNFPHRAGGRRRRRKHGGGGHPGQGQHGAHGSSRARRGAAFVGPMDHSYRNNLNGGNNSGGSGRFRPGPMVSGASGFFQHPEIEPLPASENGNTRIFAFVDDLFFRTKIQETARKLNIKLEFVKTEKEILDRLETGEQPALIIFDLNNANAKPLTTIPKLRSKLKKATSILGFVSHVQGDLKIKALEAGCDAVMPRSAFSQNLAQLLRRHGASEHAEEVPPASN